MKLQCGKWRDERRAKRFAKTVREVEKLRQWHSFYAIFPKTVAKHDCRFLERIERKLVIFTMKEGGNIFEDIVQLPETESLPVDRFWIKNPLWLNRRTRRWEYRSA